MLARGASVSATNTSGYTALHFAVANGNHRVYRVLVAGGADVLAAVTTTLLALVSPVGVASSPASPSCGIWRAHRRLVHCWLGCSAVQVLRCCAEWCVDSACCSSRKRGCIPMILHVACPDWRHVWQLHEARARGRHLQRACEVRWRQLGRWCVCTVQTWSLLLQGVSGSGLA